MERSLPVLLLAVNLFGCLAPEPRRDAPVSQGATPWTRRISSFDRALPTQPGWKGVAPPGAGGRVVATEVGSRTIRGATIDSSYGSDLERELRGFSTSQVDEYGPGLLTTEQLFGDGETAGLCEAPRLDWGFSEDGEDWEAELVVYPYTAIVNGIEPILVEIPEECAASVAASGGDVDAAEDCTEDDIHTFFAEGSSCRACVEGNAGDYAACVAADECPEEANYAVWVYGPEGDKIWYRGAVSSAWACAPDLLAPFYYLVDIDDDDPLPDSFDHSRWAGVCTPFWDEATEQPQIYCTGSIEPSERAVVAEGLFGYVGYIRPEGSDVPSWRGRQYHVDRIELDNGGYIDAFWATVPGLGAVSAPRLVEDTDGDGAVSPQDVDFGYGSGGFGFNPRETRPDGELMARDWVAAMTLKTATTIDGISIVPFQTSRCAEWEGDEGGYRCSSLGAPEDGWINDLYVTWSDTEHTRSVSYPLVTLASTGQIDPDVPGGIVTHIASAPALAAPDWEACTLPHTFVPDRSPIEDTPMDYGGAAALDAFTWNFAGHPEEDFRVVLATNQVRAWCGAGEDGVGWSALDGLL